ncbi:hypothetical protein FISHEDRAFT_74452 [Fistulina hepatica ATCC 64428]|uniref:Uncharacterized protein n=1 Tax=Fistulina hepatica ATCC 64428 TaxID=1128425 RepID=A0A0D7ACI3_9AGAR|nr:hypothetical protein FISHEDRAFT_74452 [Fistulina hepatica ATCC 64428]
MPTEPPLHALHNHLRSESVPIPAPGVATPLMPTVPEKLISAMSDTSTLAIQIVRIHATNFKHEPLSQDARNWYTWHLQIGYVLAMSGQAQFILNGKIPCPDEAVNLTSHMNWCLADNAIHVFCLQNMSPAEVMFASEFDTVHTMWSALMKRHTKLGPLAQILDMKAILDIRFSLITPITDTTNNILH